MPLSYPVNVETDRFDVYDTDLSTVVKTRVRWPRRDGMELVGAPANLVPLLRLQGADPVFDPATQYLTAPGEPVVDLGAQTSTYTRVVENYTQAQLDNIAASEADDAERNLLRAAYQTFKDGTATNSQAQRAIAWLIKQIAGVL